jgi:hypothetical protein
MVTLVDMTEGVAQRKGYAIAFPFLEVVRVERDVISPLIHGQTKKFSMGERFAISAFICIRIGFTINIGCLKF